MKWKQSVEIYCTPHQKFQTLFFFVFFPTSVNIFIENTFCSTQKMMIIIDVNINHQ